MSWGIYQNISFIYRDKLENIDLDRIAIFGVIYRIERIWFERKDCK